MWSCIVSSRLRRCLRAGVGRQIVGVLVGEAGFGMLVRPRDEVAGCPI